MKPNNMKQTELKHWQNGFQIRGGWFKTRNYTLIVENHIQYGLMLAYSLNRFVPYFKLEIFKLV